jgi:hypothetical protein
VPIVAGAVTWKRIIYVEGVLGHAFWNGSFRYQGFNLDTRNRMAGGGVAVYPFRRLPVGVVGGWIRIEQLAQEYYEYVKLSEGPVLGLPEGSYILEFVASTEKFRPSRTLSLSIDGQTLVWNPLKNPEYVIEQRLSRHATMRITSNKPLSLGHAIDICLTVSAP